MDCAAIPVSELLPHGPAMTLIDRLVDFTPQRSSATVTITKQSRFFVATGVPAWVGIEYMAQAIAAHAGLEARLRGERAPVGLLLGTRAYRTALTEFPLGVTLTITVEPVAVEVLLGSFQCSIASDRVIATAAVNVYRPAAQPLVPLHGGGSGT